MELEPELWKDRAALLARIEGCAGLVVGGQTTVDAALLLGAGSLRVVGRLGSGLENLDLVALRRAGVTLVHGGDLMAAAVAEYVIGAALNLARGLAYADREVRAGVWGRRVGIQLAGRTLGVIGLGRSGVEIARRGRALGMTVLGYDPLVSPPPEGLREAPLHKLLETADVVAIQLPFTAETANLVGGLELAVMKAGALVINASQAGVLDEEALYHAIEEGRLGGAALDARQQEPPDGDDPFTSLPNVLLTPHLAGLTVEAEAAISASVLRDVRLVLRQRLPEGPAILPD